MNLLLLLAFVGQSLRHSPVLMIEIAVAEPGEMTTNLSLRLYESVQFHHPAVDG